MATMVQAVRLALHYGETHLGVTDVFGEDVGPPLGGVFTVTQGLKTAWNSPLDERGIVGTAMGIAYAGGRPVCEIQFCDYGFNVIDLLKVAGNHRLVGGGRSRWQPNWPAVKEQFIPLGTASVVREGEDATVISYGRPLPLCVQVADQLRRDTGFAYDVIDLRSIFPYDWKTISASVQKTGRLLIVNEDTEVTNFGEHLLRRVIDEHFYDLLVRPRLLAGKHVPGIGLNQVYEQNTVPQLDSVRSALREVVLEDA